MKRNNRNSSESIDMLSRRFGYFPREFVWRGKMHHVEVIEQCWTLTHRGKMSRHYFTARCSEGSYIVYHDLKNNTWHIEEQP